MYAQPKTMIASSTAPASPAGAKAELHLQLPLDRQNGDAIDAQGQFETQAGIDGANVAAEPLDDADTFGADGVDAAGE